MIITVMVHHPHEQPCPTKVKLVSDPNLDDPVGIALNLFGDRCYFVYQVKDRPEWRQLDIRSDTLCEAFFKLTGAERREMMKQPLCSLKGF